MKRIMIMCSLLLGGCYFVDDYAFVRERAEQYYQARGFKVISYQGYNMWTMGRCYWYVTERNNIVYESCLLKWNKEMHEYSFHAIDAIKPN